MTASFVLLFVLAGVAGEVTSLAALFTRTESSLTNILVFGSLMVLVGMSGLVLAVSLAAAGKQGQLPPPPVPAQPANPPAGPLFYNE
jgi:hypothetical protein